MKVKDKHENPDQPQQDIEQMRQQILDLEARVVFSEQSQKEAEDRLNESMTQSKQMSRRISELQSQLAASELVRQEEALKAEESLTHSKKKVAYLDGIPTPVIAINKDLEIQFVNEACADMVGKSPKDCWKKKCYDIVKSRHCGTTKCAALRAMQNRGIVQDRTLLQSKGSSVPIQYAATPLFDSGGELIGAIEYIADLTEIYQIIDQVVGISDQLTNASRLLNDIACHVGDSTAQVAVSSHDISQVLSNETKKTQEIATIVSDLKMKIDLVNAGSKQQLEFIESAVKSAENVNNVTEQMEMGNMQVAQAAGETIQTAKDASEKVEQTVDKMQSINDIVHEASEKVSQLGDQSEEIGKITNVIEDIAAQTNLLALNAAIEAARAGEHGRGFAVVADEVRKLAERTSSATGSIASLIKSIQNGIAESVTVMETGTERVNEGSDMAIRAGEAMEGIVRASEQVRTQIAQISAVSEQVCNSASEVNVVMGQTSSVSHENMESTRLMTEFAQQVNESITNSATMAEKNSASTDQLSLVADDLNDRANEVVKASQSLSEMAERLMSAVSGFSITC